MAMEILLWFMIAVALSLGIVNLIVSFNDTESWLNLHTKVATLEEKVRNLENQGKGR